ncbi:restriction endonuclease subunit S [Flavonifractor plautii]|uniref:restriction endonuclease subunit S n=1 Tax=Flavonifractor plautii TaxID=292800 RepID=UPI0019577884|nr:restriction endonuclease subunit S [Flavonifractor plautii]MBM6788802.1 restriction endonuclease subunit S [Flavonifractor plautii]
MDTKALRQKVLDLAIRGKLVPQDPNDEPASVLLERIRQQKKQMVRDGKLKPKDIKNDTIIFVGEDNLHYEKFADGSVKCIEDEIPFDLPEGWAWSRLGTVAEAIGDGDHQPPPQTSSSVPFLVISNVSGGQLSFENTRFVSEEYFSQLPETRKPRNGDLLFTVTGSYGIPVLVDTDDKFCFQRHIAIVRPCIISNRYFYVVLGSSYVKSICDAKATGTAQKTVGLATLRELLIPVAPYKEQMQIYAQTQDALSIVDSISSDKEDLLNIIENTKAKILNLAIRGQLVPQDLNDEPASVLLERTRSEKEELIRQGKIKRDKKESVIFRGEDNSYYEKISDKVTQYDVDELPWGWGVGSFSQCNLFAPETINPSASPDEMFELYSVPNFEEGVPEIICGREIGSSKQSICEHDVLVCKINPRINRVWITGHITPYQLLGSSEWIVFRNHLLFAPYLRYYFSSPRFRELILSNVSGVGGSLMRAQPESVKKYPVFIPPYQEQIGITERINELFTLLEVIEKSLN